MEEMRKTKRSASPTIDPLKRSNVMTAMQRAERCAMARDQMITQNESHILLKPNLNDISQNKAI